MFIIGHRGARGEAPENTLSGFHYLQSLGILAVELDIQVSGDGELVVIHDYVLERTTSGRGSVHEKTVAELAALDACHNTFKDWPEREGIPTLRQVMEVLRDFEHIQFEVKAKTEAHAQRVAALFPPLWREFGFGERAFTTSFNPRYLQIVAELAPEILRGLLIEKEFMGDAVQLATALGCRSLGPNQEICSRELIGRAHDAGLTVSTWTVNPPERMLELLTDGVDSIITDKPTLALATLAGKL